VARCIVTIYWQGRDRTKPNQNKNFAEMEKIQQTHQNEKFSKMQRIQKFAKEGTANKNAQNQNYPNISPKEKKFRKTKNENKTAQTKANAEQNQAKDMRRDKFDLGVMGSVMMGRGKRQVK